MKMNKEIVMVRLSDIIPNRFQPRLTFDDEALSELSESIKEHGIIQPLILRDLGNKYEIIAGERRFKAAQLAGVLEVPAVIGQMDNQTSAELALIENIQRKDLSAIEEAKSYKKILDMGGFTQEELAKRMGKGQSTIANKMRLLNLTNEVQMALMNNLISERHARCLLQVKDENLQKDILNKIISERLNVRDTDDYIKSVLGKSNDDRKIDEVKTDEDVYPNQQNIADEQVKKENDGIDSKINPNVYTQTKNIDFIDLNNLNLPESQGETESDLTSNDGISEINIPAIETDDTIKSDSNESVQYDDLPQIKEQERSNDTMVNDLYNEEKLSPKPNDMSKIKIATAIRLAKDSLDEIKKAGYEASLEEKDNDTNYQIIINIQK